MRVPRHLVWSVLASFLLVGVAPATVRANGTRGHRGVSCPVRDRSRTTSTAPNPQLERYYQGDWRLGPKNLPRTGPIGKMLRGYHRAGHASPYWFLGCYWQTDPQLSTSGWWLPDLNGFVLVHGRPVVRPLTLRRGQLVDLFGSGRGNFLDPAGTPYAKRAIPPSDLDTYDPAFPAGYHLYRVITPFTVKAGQVRPWFGQPGRGLQYLTSTSIPNLVTSMRLKPLN